MQMRVDLKRHVHRDNGGPLVAVANANMREARYGAEVARLQLQGAADIAQALALPALQEVKRRALVPGFRPIRLDGNEPIEALFGGGVLFLRHCRDGVVHDLRAGAAASGNPDLPDLVLDFIRVAHGRVRLEPLKQSVQAAMRAHGCLALSPRDNELQNIIRQRVQGFARHKFKVNGSKGPVNAGKRGSSPVER
jgi:hypothetical protein